MHPAVALLYLLGLCLVLIGHSYALFIMLQESGLGVEFATAAAARNTQLDTTIEEDQQPTISTRVKRAHRKKQHTHADISPPRNNKQREISTLQSSLQVAQPGLFLDIAKR
jgi:hypothetical protein